MRSRECTNEHEVVAAARRGALDGALQSHVKSCPSCREAAAVASALASLRDGDVPARTPVDARVLWLKAQLMPRSFEPAASGAASRGVAAVWAVVAACWTLFLAWRWTDLRHLLEMMTPERLLTTGASPASLPVASLGVVMLMAAVTLAIMLHQVFVEEL